MIWNLIGLLQEFIIGHHSIFHKQAQAFPFLFEFLSFLIKDLFQFIRHFFRDMVIDLFYIRIALQITAANVQRNIRAVDHAMQQHQEFGNDIFYFIGYKDLVAVQLDLVFLNFVALFDLREI